jgi:hypothetical protein
MTLGEIKAHVVDAFPGNARRLRLFHRLEELVQAFLLAGIPCEIWLNGSLLTRKDEPNDLDGTVILEPDVSEALTVEQSQLVEDATAARIASDVDSFVWVKRRREDPLFGDEAADPAFTWGEQYGCECSEQWLKGFVVMKLGETDVGLRICR